MMIKKTISVLLSLMIMFTVVCGCFAVTVNAEDKITYSYVITTDEAVNAFEGKIHYPAAALSVNSITFSGQKNDKNGTILFNDSNAQTPFDFSNGKSLITVEFTVNGDYDAADIYGELSDFYNIASVASGNTPFDYANVINGEVVSCGHVDIDIPANSYENTKYTIVYSYKENAKAAQNSQYTKTAWSNLDNAITIAELNKPAIENPYYKNYSVTEAALSEKTINATLTGEEKEYTVSLNGTEQGKYKYLETATVSDNDETRDFIVEGNRVFTGKSFSFFVTGDVNITTDTPSGAAVSENATLINNALYVCDKDNSAVVKMEMLASATSSSFKRMGVAFAATQKTAAEVQEAVKHITSGPTEKYEKIAVHNSAVDNPNQSGQYQFIYAPYISVRNVTSDKSLYFYAFVVDNNGNVAVSAAAEVKFANVLS